MGTPIPINVTVYMDLRNSIPGFILRGRNAWVIANDRYSALPIMLSTSMIGNQNAKVDEIVAITSNRLSKPARRRIF
jgi:hypothetical protein